MRRLRVYLRGEDSEDSGGGSQRCLHILAEKYPRKLSCVPARLPDESRVFISRLKMIILKAALSLRCRDFKVRVKDIAPRMLALLRGERLKEFWTPSMRSCDVVSRVAGNSSQSSSDSGLLSRDAQGRVQPFDQAS